MDVQNDVLFLLYDVARLMRVEADKRAARLHGLTRAQWVILIRLDRQPGLSQKELAEILEVEPITVARLVDRLEARGMVERRPDPRDRRIWRLHLLPPSQPVLEDIAVERQIALEKIGEGVAPETIAVMTTALQQMKANLSADRPPARRLEAARIDHDPSIAREVA